MSDHQRATGVALPGLDSRLLAKSIVWAHGSALHMADLDGDADVETLAAAIEARFVMLAKTLYAATTSL